MIHTKCGPTPPGVRTIGLHTGGAEVPRLRFISSVAGLVWNVCGRVRWINAEINRTTPPQLFAPGASMQDWRQCLSASLRIRVAAGPALCRLYVVLPEQDRPVPSLR